MCSKKIFSIFLFVLFFSSVLLPQAALKEGVYNLSGGVSYSSSENTMKNESTRQNNLNISPSYNYFIIDNLLVGCALNFNYTELEYASNYYKSTKFIYRSYGIGPNVRYYFSSQKIFPFVGASVNYWHDIGSSQEGNRMAVTAGLNFFLTENAAIEPYFEYAKSSYNQPDQKISTFSFGCRMNYFINVNSN